MFMEAQDTRHGVYPAPLANYPGLPLSLFFIQTRQATEPAGISADNGKYGCHTVCCHVLMPYHLDCLEVVTAQAP
jgi:hypothetical protein